MQSCPVLTIDNGRSILTVLRAVSFGDEVFWILDFGFCEPEAALHGIRVHNICLDI